MKNLHLLLLFCIASIFITSKTYGQANVFINVIPSNSGIVSVGGTIDVIVFIGNTGPISAIPPAKLRPVTQVPTSVTFLPNAQQTGLPAGWTILTNSGSQIRVCNTSRTLPVNTIDTIVLKATGVTIAPAQTVAANINFGNGTTCAPGTSVAGDITTDNSALTTIEVVAAAPSVTAVGIPNACNGKQNAAINATATGFTGSLTWSLNPAVGLNNNNGTFNNLTAGTYTVTVSNGTLSTSTVVTLVDPPALSNTFSVVFPTCHTGTNGSITINSTGGTPYSGAPGPYVVELWQGNPGSGIQISSAASSGSTIFINQGAGQYFVRCLDSNSCADTLLNINLLNPDAISFTATPSQINCAGGTSTVTLMSSGGTGTITYSQNSSAVTSPVSGLVAGSYTFIATDANACSLSAVVNITEPSGVILNASSTNAVCNGVNGSLTFSANGGTGAISFLVNNTAATSPALRPAGDYTIIAADANSCSISTVVSITEPSALALNASSTNATCNGVNGSLIFSATGGTGATSFLVNNTAATSPALSPAGDYTIIATDANSCSVSTVVSITEPSAIVLNASSTNAACHGGDGSLIFSATGGTGTVTFLVNNSAATSPALVPAGDYTIIATDANSCSVSSVISITEPSALVINKTIVSLPSCSTPNAVVAVNASGGSGTLSYTSTVINANGTFTLSCSSQPYMINVTNGACTAQDSILVNCVDPITLTASLDSSIKCNGGVTSISAIGSGGSSYTYTLSGASSSTNSTGEFTNLLAGVYTITVAGNGNQACSSSTTISISEPSEIVITPTVVNPQCGTGTTGTISVSASGGTPFTIMPFYTVLINGNPILPSYPIGCDTIKVTDANGCFNEKVVCIIAAANLGVVANASSTNVCDGSEVTFTGSSTLGNTLTYTWSNGTTGVQPQDAIPFIVNQSAIYTVTGTDGACSETATVSITVNANPVLNLTALQPKCHSELGEISFTINGCISNCVTTFIDSIQSLTSPVTNLAANSYTLVTTNINGCKDTSSIVINAAPAELVHSITVTNPSCASDTVGQINVMVTGGTPVYTTTVDNVALISMYGVGEHIVKTVDANMCEISDTIEIIAAAPFGVQANASALSICAGTAVTFTGSTTSNIPLNFTWSNGIQDNVPFVVSYSQTYTVTGSNSSCSETSVITITTNSDTAQLSQANATNSSSIAGNSCSDALLQPDGSTINYSDANCNLIATVRDYSAGANLGNVTACVQVVANTPTWNGQPYVARTHTITPTNQGPAEITLYYTNDDIMDYNNYIISSGSSFPQFAAPLNPQNNDSFLVCITKIDGGALGIGTVASVIQTQMRWNAAMNRWQAKFPVTGFSSFYAHTLNANNAPLTVSLVEFNGYKENTYNVLNWITNNEKDNKEFKVLHSTDGVVFEPVATVQSKAVNGTYGGKLNYQAVHLKPAVGHNFYKLQQIALDNSVSYSNTIDIVWNFDGASVVVYPNPANNELHIDLNVDRSTSASIFIYDATGKLVQQTESSLIKGLNTNTIDLSDISSGIYLLKVTDGRGLMFTQQFRKQ